MMLDYAAFLRKKAQYGRDAGFEPVWMPDFLFGFQRALVEWAIRKGRSAIFADCGLGKTPMQLVWAENVVRRENKPVLIVTPLAVSHQTIREGEKFGIEVHRGGGHGTQPARIVVTNYERLHHFTPSEFIGVVCDESSILKSFDGVRRAAITEFMRTIPYRLLCTATAAPNDYVELGTSSEALGELGHMDMLNRFFRNEQNTSDTAWKWRGKGGEKPHWRFKGHAELPFWRWVCSWARAIRRPSDLGFPDDGFILPALTEQRHMVEAQTLAPEMLFALPAVGLREQREERRRTIQERCETVAVLATERQPVLIWCHLNAEGDLLAKLIPDSIQISGDDADEAKEEKFLAFMDSKTRVLITKPKIGAWGLNFQHCAHVVCFPSHSYESYYQGVRRCWRYGQSRLVVVDVVMTEGDTVVMQNLRRKAAAADRMFSSLVAFMNEARRIQSTEDFISMETPAWLS